MQKSDQFCRVALFLLIFVKSVFSAVLFVPFSFYLVFACHIVTALPSSIENTEYREAVDIILVQDRQNCGVDGTYGHVPTPTHNPPPPPTPRQTFSHVNFFFFDTGRWWTGLYTVNHFIRQFNFKPYHSMLQSPKITKLLRLRPRPHLVDFTAFPYSPPRFSLCENYECPLLTLLLESLQRFCGINFLMKVIVI